MDYRWRGRYDVHEDLEEGNVVRISTPRGEITLHRRAIPPHLATFEVPVTLIETFQREAWRATMDAYRQGKLDL